MKMAYRSNGHSGDDNDRETDETNSNMNHKPTYLMEHLATFTVAKETGIMDPTDGMRRLFQLEKTNGIWSQKMQLCLDCAWVLIMDYETGGVMERFPVKSIQEPTAFTSHDPMEMYNNILVFNVTNSNQSYPTEMHIFQCQAISADDLADDLKLLKMGKTLVKNRQHTPAVNIKQVSRGSESELTTNNDDSSSTTSEKYERDVTILNHCFDDIEKFIARLQHAAAAARELDRRRRNRKNRKRDMGDGMLTMRTKPPPEKDFINIFQKFKLSFNLLAKLKAHIHDPNAPELVHFLFTPLALIVEAAHETYFNMHLPHKIVTPLLTREAINLLMNCVTSKETELWHSLGNSWLIPRDQWKGHVSSYHPVFMDGWSPDYPVIDESSIDTHYSDYNDYEHSMGQGNNFIYDSGKDVGGSGVGGVDPHASSKRDATQPDVTVIVGDSTRSDISIDSIEQPTDGDTKESSHNNHFEKSQSGFLEELQTRGVHIVQVTYPRTANNDKELTVMRGEILEILDDSRKWWKAMNSKGQTAHVPHTIVTTFHSGMNDIYNNPLYTTNPNFRRTAHRSESPTVDRFYPSNSTNLQGVNAPNLTSSADWVRKERLGKKGEFRYF